MASLSGESAAAESPNDPASQASSMPSLTIPSLLDHDSEEWDYEYSNSETEFYYLTLDLPMNPSVIGGHPAPRKGRGGYKSVWIGESGPKREHALVPKTNLPTVGGAESNSAPTPAPAASGEEDDAEDDTDIEDEEDEPVQEVAKEGPDVEIREKAEAIEKEIQILELHSENPFVVFRGHTFSCSWAENIGTELLFVDHDSAGTLPILRSLSDGVDLVAASSARIVSRIATFAPKPYERHIALEGEGQDESGFCESEKTAYIPLNNRVSDERKAQGRFLERVMDVKQKKGETDAVTVFTRARIPPAAWQTLVNDRRMNERETLDSQLHQGGDAAAAAAQRLADIEREDKEDVEREKESLELGRKRRIWRSAERIENRKPKKRAKRGQVIDPGMVLRRPRNDIDKKALKANERPLRMLAPKPSIDPQGTGSTSMPQDLDDLEPEDSMGESMEDENGVEYSDEDYDE